MEQEHVEVCYICMEQGEVTLWEDVITDTFVCKSMGSKSKKDTDVERK